jgi:U3 small nucleolar RNA-associated protein MPP10
MASTTRSLSPSMTSTSHTMTADPLFRVPAKIGARANSSEKSDLSMVLKAALESGNRHVFIQPSSDICDSALEQAKRVLDGVAAEICDEQALRKVGKRKRGERDGTTVELRIRRIHTEGFGVEQIWEQARRVIDAAKEEVGRELKESGILEVEKKEGKNGRAKGEMDVINFYEDGSEASREDESMGDDVSGDGRDERSLVEMSEGDEGNDDFSEAGEKSANGDEESGEAINELVHSPEDSDDLEDENEPADFYVEDPNGLNDGFFSIEEFNKQTEFLEQQDTAGDPFTGEASDEEDIDWDADPMSIPIPKASLSKRAATVEDGSSEDEDEDGDENDQGPTFGNTGLKALEGESSDDDSDIDLDGTGTGDNTNDILYKDFFEPPPRKARKGERQAKFLDRQARKSKLILGGDHETEMKTAMANVRRDLFEDNPENEDPEDAISDADPSDPKSRKSAHERRQAKLAEEIRRLEAASVAKREWTISGEARAVDRPINSLLEEDLDFERTGKPVTVVTAEVSESIEELIKRRILAQEFDEVIRRRPDSDSVPANARRGVFELDDTKAQQSLAEIYEEEHIKATNPDTYMSKADDKLKKQHQEIEMLWKEVSAKLDALSSWHYKPKPPVPSLTVVADVATISMEDAQPATATGLAGGESMLAPQEIYKAGKDKGAIQKGEVLPKSGVPVARQEMTREEKLRRRRREKERMKKRGGGELNKKPEGAKSIRKKEMLSELKKGGVKVIWGKGEIRDVDGNNVKNAPTVNGAGSFKL